VESKHENGYILHDGLSALDNPRECNVASLSISGRHLFPCEDFRKMEQVLDFSFIESKTRRNTWNAQLQVSHMQSYSSYRNKYLDKTTLHM
jgi:hypothetical protein